MRLQRTHWSQHDSLFGQNIKGASIMTIGNGFGLWWEKQHDFWVGNVVTLSSGKTACFKAKRVWDCWANNF